MQLQYNFHILRTFASTNVAHFSNICYCTVEIGGHHPTLMMYERHLRVVEKIIVNKILAIHILKNRFSVSVCVMSRKYG